MVSFQFYYYKFANKTRTNVPEELLSNGLRTNNLDKNSNMKKYTLNFLIGSYHFICLISFLTITYLFLT